MRNLSPQQEQAVLNLRIPGMHFFKDGIAGIEKVIDHASRESKNPIPLPIDMKIQNDVRDELQKKYK